MTAVSPRGDGSALRTSHPSRATLQASQCRTLRLTSHTPHWPNLTHHRVLQNRINLDPYFLEISCIQGGRYYLIGNRGGHAEFFRDTHKLTVFVFTKKQKNKWLLQPPSCTQIRPKKPSLSAEPKPNTLLTPRLK